MFLYFLYEFGILSRDFNQSLKIIFSSFKAEKSIKVPGLSHGSLLGLEMFCFRELLFYTHKCYRIRVFNYNVNIVNFGNLSKTHVPKALFPEIMIF